MSKSKFSSKRVIVGIAEGSLIAIGVPKVVSFYSETMEPWVKTKFENKSNKKSLKELENRISALEEALK